MVYFKIEWLSFLKKNKCSSCILSCLGDVILITKENHDLQTYTLENRNPLPADTRLVNGPFETFMESYKENAF